MELPGRTARSGDGMQELRKQEAINAHASTCLCAAGDRTILVMFRSITSQLSSPPEAESPLPEPDSPEAESPSPEPVSLDLVVSHLVEYVTL